MLDDQLNEFLPEEMANMNGNNSGSPEHDASEWPSPLMTPDKRSLHTYYNNDSSQDNDSYASYINSIIAGSRESTPSRPDVGEKPTSASKSSASGYKDCPVCGKSITANNLNKHIRTHGGDQYTCNVCPKSYTTKSNLQAHLRTHSGERPYNCTICDKDFATYCILKVHLRTHTGEKPFHCETCGQSFAKSIHLKRHEAIHTGIKPHQCTLCGKRFSRSDHLKRHVQSIHSLNRPHICVLCGKDFVRKYELEKHMKQHSESVSAVSGASGDNSLIDLNRDVLPLNNNNFVSMIDFQGRNVLTEGQNSHGESLLLMKQSPQNLSSKIKLEENGVDMLTEESIKVEVGDVEVKMETSPIAAVDV